nr:FeoB-associated Cys-rich membrane protein [uncultured Sellimonas sp.]
MVNIIIGLILLVMIGAAAAYIVKAKKNGQKCIGCSAGCCCSQKKCKKE